MSIGTDEHKAQVLQSLLSEARTEADEIRTRLKKYEQIIRSTRIVMGHELKKPATAIRGYLDLVCEDLEAANQLNTLSYAEKARHECSLLEDLNNFFLGMLEIDRGEEKAGRELVDVERMIGETVAHMPSELSAGDRVVVDVTNDVSRVPCDGKALKLILINIVENALLYSNPSSPVRVKVGIVPEKRGMKGGELLKLRIDDDGFGIPVEYRQKVFSPFVRLRDDVADGAGLGVTLGKSLVELNSGEVYVDSATGAGTPGHVTLPLRVDGGQHASHRS